MSLNLLQLKSGFMTRPCCLDCSIPDGLPPRTSSTPWPRSRVTYSVTARPSRQCTRGLTLCLSFQRARSSQHATLHAYAHPVPSCRLLSNRGAPTPAAQPLCRAPHMSCLFNACLHRQNPCRALLLTPLVHLAHGTEPGLDEADPGGLPGDWWIGTLPCTQEAGILCGMNDCGQKGIEGTAQAQRRLIQGIVTCVPILHSPGKQHSPQQYQQTGDLHPPAHR